MQRPDKRAATLYGPIHGGNPLLHGGLPTITIAQGSLQCICTAYLLLGLVAFLPLIIMIGGTIILLHLIHVAVLLAHAIMCLPHRVTE